MLAHLHSQMLVILIFSITVYSYSSRDLVYPDPSMHLSMLDASPPPFRMALPPRKHKSFQRVLREIEKAREGALALPLESGQYDRRSPLKGGPATPKAQINVTVFTHDLLSTRNKYARAAEILAGKGLVPATKFPMVDEWTKNHTWDEPIGQEMHKRGDGISGAWPLMTHMIGGMDVLYYGFFSIGSPAQNLSIEIDTGSADMWLATSKCSECTISSSNSQYPSKRVYRSSSSSTSQERREGFHAGYGSGGVCGSMTLDKMEISGFKVDAQDFGGVYKQSKTFQTSPNSGLLGLSFGTIASSKKLPFFENLLAKRQVPNPYFGVYLTRGKTTGSELCLACVNTSKWTYWTVPMTGFRTQPTTRMQLTQAVTAVVDTGTSLIYFPPRLAAAFYSTIPQAREATDISAGSWVFPCNTAVNVAMEINGVMLEMSSRDFILGRAKKDSTECVGAVVGIGDNGSFPSGLVIMGAAFLKNWYTVYDYSHGGRVGFGRLAPGN